MLYWENDSFYVPFSFLFVLGVSVFVFVLTLYRRKWKFVDMEKKINIEKNVSNNETEFEKGAYYELVELGRDEMISLTDYSSEHSYLCMFLFFCLCFSFFFFY